MEDRQPANTRKFMRVDLHEGVMASMDILRVNGCHVNSNIGRVLLVNLSPAGLKFITPLRLKPEAKWRVRLRFRLEGEDVEVRGFIRWGQKEPEDNWQGYGIEFDPSPTMRSHIIRILNRRLLQLKFGQSRLYQLYYSQTDSDRYPPKYLFRRL